MEWKLRSRAVGGKGAKRQRWLLHCSRGNDGCCIVQEAKMAAALLITCRVQEASMAAVSCRDSGQGIARA
jgi:hypothetical protein